MKINKYITLIGIIALTSACRPYNAPDIEEIQSFETVFVIPLEGNINKQVKFDSYEQVESYKVSSRRVEVPKRWRTTGYSWLHGEYIPTIRVIKVDRTPVTVEWTPEIDLRGVESGEGRKTGDGIWVESSDSIGFSTGFRITAQIEEDDTSLYLYSYRGNNLAKVLETEVKSKIQENFANYCAQYSLDNLRDKKNEMYTHTKENVLPFFKEKGITITTLAMFGGFTYENPDIQNAIDKTFIAQQEKVVSAAQLAAQNDKNERIKLEAQATAEAIRIESLGKADAIEQEKKAEAEGIRLVTEAAEAAQKNPLVLELRKLEIEKLKNEKWDGSYPNYYMNIGQDNSAPNLLLQVPTPE